MNNSALLPSAAVPSKMESTKSHTIKLVTIPLSTSSTTNVSKLGSAIAPKELKDKESLPRSGNSSRLSIGNSFSSQTNLMQTNK